MKIILEFHGEDMSKAVCAMDDEFDFTDDLIWDIDYGELNQVTRHTTEYGDITITKVEE